MATPVTLATSPIFNLVTPGAAPIATDESFPAINLNTGDQDFDVMLNDTFAGVPTITITSQTGPGTATVFPLGPGRASRIRVPTGPGLAGGTKTVTYQLTATGNTGSDTGVMTVILNAPAAVTLPLTPAMDFLASDGALPANPVYVYDTNLGNLHDGSSPAQAKEIQAAINAATAGTNLVAIAAQAGGTTSYNRYNGLDFRSAANGTSGAKITLMARPGDTVIIDKGVQYVAFRTPSAAGVNWNGTQESGGLYIWKSISAGFGAARPLGGVWFEGGWPHYILPCDTLAHLQAPNGLQRIWANYGGPAALVHTDGHIYVRWQIPYAPKMSQNNKWPQDHRLDYMPGWVSGGQLRFPVTQDPKDYSIWLTDAPPTDYTTSAIINAMPAFHFGSKSWWTIGEGINSFGFMISYQTAGSSNIEVRRGTDFAVQVGIAATSADMPGPFTFRRRRMTQGVLKHQQLLNWKFGGPLEVGYRGAWGGIEMHWALDNLICRDCTFHGWHDFFTGTAHGMDIQQCTMIQVFDDGFQVPPAWFYNNDLHYCYFLDCVWGGPGQVTAFGTFTGDALGPTFISHCIFDNRCCKLVDTGTGYEPYVSMPMMQLHFAGGGEMPLKFFNNTVVFSPDQQGSIDFWVAHVRGDNPVIRSGAFHEVFNCIYVRNDYQRYYGKNPSAGAPSSGEGWSAQSDEMVGRIVCGGGSKELYDFIILHRDVPSVVSNYFREIVDTPVSGQAASSHGGADYTSLSNWLGSSKFTNSKGIYSPGFFANSYQVNPQMPSAPSGGNVGSFDARRNYRPAATQANNGFTGTVNAPSGLSMASWKVKPHPWIGALDPAGTTCPIGVQSP